MNRVTIAESARVVRPKEIMLDAVLRLPMAARKRHGMRTRCDACRESITDEYFYAGFSIGHRNLLLHERCTPEGMRDVASGSESNPGLQNQVTP